MDKYYGEILQILDHAKIICHEAGGDEFRCPLGSKCKFRRGTIMLGNSCGFDDILAILKRVQQNPPVKEGDVIQTGYRIQGSDEIQWGAHQVIRGVQLDGTPYTRPREAKVNKHPTYWRFPVESLEIIIKDLRRYANPKEGKAAISRLQQERK
jgi:hypothetical protein